MSKKLDNKLDNTSTNTKKLVKKKNVKTCSFCGKTKEQVYVLFTGDHACICNDCAE